MAALWSFELQKSRAYLSGDTGILPHWPCVSTWGQDPWRFVLLASREGTCLPDIASSKRTKGNTVLPVASLLAPNIAPAEALLALCFWQYPLFPHTIFSPCQRSSIFFVETFFLVCLFCVLFCFSCLPDILSLMRSKTEPSGHG